MIKWISNQWGKMDYVKKKRKKKVWEQLSTI